jgi:hypothetical protein
MRKQPLTSNAKLPGEFIGASESTQAQQRHL